MVLSCVLPTMSSTTSEGGNKRSASEVKPPLVEPASKRSSSPHGYSTYVREFRSVLHHPIGLPLVRALHSSPGTGGDGDNEEEEFPLVKEYFPYFFEDHGGGATVAAADAVGPAAAGADDCAGGPDPSAAAAAAAVTVDNLFQLCHTSWRNGKSKNEPALTKKLADAIRSTLSDFNLTVTGEARVEEPYTGGTGRVDVLVSNRVDDYPLLAVEVGLENKLWWTKLDQGLRYLRYQKTFGTSEATLLAVVTLEEVGRTTSARLGVFLVTPKLVQRTFESGVRQTSVEFRVSLLRHDETERIGNLSKGFGRFLRVTCDLPGYIAASRAMLDRGAYRYLGPNCCQIKINDSEKWVLRSYDNRACYTERRPDVYLHSGVTGETKIVCDIRAAGRAEPSDRDFGTRHLWSNTLVWLWKEDRETSCRLFVISTPFREGNHYATSPRDFVPVVEHLEQLHAAGYAHGDIRCFNLATGPKGGLFDFDLGGKLRQEGETTEVLKYPYGYNPAVTDGTRLGRAEEPITKFHDVYALTQVIFRFHVLQPGNMKRKPLLRRLLGALLARGSSDLEAKKNELSMFGEPSEDYENLPATEIEEKISTHMAEVKKFLESASAQQWFAKPESSFSRELKKHGFVEAPGDASTRRPTGSGAATGSPSKLLLKM